MKTLRSKISVVHSLLMSLVLAPASALHCSADEVQPAWDKTPVTQELTGMRNFSWAMAEVITGGMRQSDPAKYPGVHKFLDQSANALAAIDPNNSPGEWPELDVNQLVTRNPAFWAACYEVAPGDPLLMWLHTCYYGINGDVHRVFYSQSLALRSNGTERIRKEMSRLLISSGRVIALCQEPVNKGVAHHDNDDFAQAEAIYRDVLTVCPKHSSALYELGFTLRTAAKGDDSVSQPYFDKARQHDPFMLSAYQGSFTAEQMQERVNIGSAAMPQFQAMMKVTPEAIQFDDLELLSKALQDGGLHELALICRQTVVSRRDDAYNDADRTFIETSLSKLLPDSEVAAVTDLLTNEHLPRLTIELKR